MKTITFHSYKGGTGKTSIAVNFAWYLAVNGHNTCLIDFDLRAPSLHSYFPLSRNEQVNYFTDYLLDLSPIEDIFRSIPVTSDNPSLFWISRASFEFIRQESEQRQKLIQKDTSILPKLFKTIKYLENLGFNYLIIDNMPGVSYRALDALIASSHIVNITRPSISDVTGLKELAVNIYSRLSEDARVGLIINQREEQDDRVQAFTKESKELMEDLKLQARIHDELQKAMVRLNNLFEFHIIAHIPRIPFLVERIYVPDKLDLVMKDHRLQPFIEALHKLKKWVKEG